MEPLLIANEENNTNYDVLTNEERKVMIYSYQQALVTSQVYRLLVLLGMFLVCLSHGSNDVANAISPLVYLINLEKPDTPSFVPFLVGGLGISLGLVLLGHRVMATIGNKIIKLDFFKGYAT